MSAYVVAARRTPVAPRGGALARVEAHDLGAAAARACLADANILPGEVDELIAGNALGAGGNPARVTALAAGLPRRVAGLSLDRQCCGGLDALMLARALIADRQAEVVLAGGVESYSRRPLRLRTDPDGGPPEPYEQARFTPWRDRDPPMDEAAELLAAQLGITRAAQDDWAIASHAKALAAQDRLAGEIVPVPGVALDHDPFARRLGAAARGAGDADHGHDHSRQRGGGGGRGGLLPGGLGTGGGAGPPPGAQDRHRRHAGRRAGPAGARPGRGHRRGAGGGRGDSGRRWPSPK